MLENVLANICSEISKTWLILWKVYTCNLKGLEEVEKLGRNECTLHRLARPLSTIGSVRKAGYTARGAVEEIFIMMKKLPRTS